MIRSPDQYSPGKQFELRVSASDLEFDKRLAALTIPEARQRLPGFLHLFSQQQFLVSIDDRDIDGDSFTETRFRGFQMKVSKHTRNKFSLERQAGVDGYPGDVQGLRVRVGLQLGTQAASAIMAPPYFTAEQRAAELIPLYYAVPHPLTGGAAEEAYGQLVDYLEDRPRGVVDELSVVEGAVRHRSLRYRRRDQETHIFSTAVTSSDQPFTDQKSDDYMESLH